MDISMDHSLSRIKKIRDHLINSTNSPNLKSNEDFSHQIRSNRPLKVLISGSDSQIAYSLLPLISNGEMFGHDQKIILHLLDSSTSLKALDGIRMELMDALYPLVVQIICTDKYRVAFDKIDFAIILTGCFDSQRSSEETNDDFLIKNISIFKNQGLALDRYASKNVKVLIVGNFANTNCSITMAFANSIPSNNFSALSRLDMNKSRCLLAQKLSRKLHNTSISPLQIQNVIIWGNYEATRFADYSNTVYIDHSFYPNNNNNNMPISGLINNVYSLCFKNDDEFIKEIQKLEGENINSRWKSNSSMSIAKAILDHMKDWISGSNECVSMSVISDGSYDIPKGLVFSFPVRCSGNGKYDIIKNFVLDDISQRMVKIATDKLLEEQKIVFNMLGIKG